MKCNKILPLYTKGGGQVDDAGNWIPGQGMFVRNVSMDFQPYSTELLLKDYGYNIEVTNRLFIQNAVDIKIGMYFIEDNIEYEVRKVVPWDTYSEVMIYGVPKQS